MFQAVSSCFRLFQAVSGCFRLFRDVSGCFGLFPGVSGCFRMFQAVLGCCFGLFQAARRLRAPALNPVPLPVTYMEEAPTQPVSLVIHPG